MNNANGHDPIGLPAKVGASSVSAIFMAWGLLVVVMRVFDGRTKRGVSIHLTGQDAVLMGLIIMAFGAMPLALLARNSKGAAIWASACALVGVALVVTLLR